MEAVRATAEGVITVKAKEVKAFGTEAADAPLKPAKHQPKKSYAT